MILFVFQALKAKQVETQSSVNQTSVASKTAKQAGGSSGASIVGQTKSKEAQRGSQIYEEVASDLSPPGQPGFRPSTKTTWWWK